MKKPAIAGLLLFLLLAAFPITSVLAEEAPPPEAPSTPAAAPTLPPEADGPLVAGETPLPSPTPDETPLPSAMPAETPVSTAMPDTTPPVDTPKPLEPPAATPEPPPPLLMDEPLALLAPLEQPPQGPDYIITVPQTVDFGTLVPMSGEKTVTFKLHVEANNLTQGRLDICVAPPGGTRFTLQNGSGFTVPYKITCAEESFRSAATLISIFAPDNSDVSFPGTPSSLPFEAATPSGLFSVPSAEPFEKPEPVDMSLEVQLSLDTDAITQSGSYTGTMVFLADYVPIA